MGTLKVRKDWVLWIHWIVTVTNGAVNQVSVWDYRMRLLYSVQLSGPLI